MYSKALLDNYEADENLHEKPSVTKQREEDAFIDAIIKTNRGPMQIVFDYLRKKGKVSMKVWEKLAGWLAFIQIYLGFKITSSRSR